MPSFMPIGPKLWALEGYIHTDRHTDRQTVLLLLYRLAYRLAPRTFQLALRGYSVASLPRASRFALASCLLCLRAFRALPLHLACFARARFTLCANENFRKKSVSQSTRNALKRIEMQK